MTNMVYTILFSICFYFQAVQSLIVNITVTTDDINLNNFKNIVNQFYGASSCRFNYSINVVPYNLTRPFDSPVGKNNFFPNIQLVFGPKQYFSPSFFKFTNTRIFNFPNSYIQDYFMEYPLRLKIMLQAVNFTVKNDPKKMAVFIINGSYVDPMQPWKRFNPMIYLSSFIGTVNLQLYFPGREAPLCSAILASGIVTIAMDLSTAGALSVLNACNDRNLLNWRYRWLVFFSSISFLNDAMLRGLSLRQNFTIYDYSHSNDYNTVPIVTSNEDIILSDIAYTVVKMMDISTCKAIVPALLKLRTGEFTFTDGVVSRSNWLLEIFKSNGSTIYKVGNGRIINQSITLDEITIPNFDLTQLSNILKEMKTKPFRVAIMRDRPFGFYNSINGTLNGSGYSYEMIDAILRNLSVTPNITFYNLPNGMLRNNRINGMLGLLQDGQADIVVGPITEIAKYKPYVDFTRSYMTYNVAILYKVNTTNAFEQMFYFIFAFNYVVWILVIGSCVIYAIALTLVNLASPNEAQFGFLYSFLLIMGSMVQGVTTALPDKISGRILIIFWWIFNIVILLAYVASFGAILTNNRFQANITQLSDLFLQNQYSYGTVKDSAIDYYLETSTLPDIQNINQVIRSQYSNLLTPDVNTAIQNVQTRSFAFIYEDRVLQNYTNVPCMTLITSHLQFKLVFALPSKSDFTNITNNSIESLNQSFLEQLQRKYFPPIIPPSCKLQNWLETILDILSYPILPNILYSLNIRELGGIFVIMLIGIILSIITATIEYIVRKCKKNSRGEKMD